ncbi:hypothetical protein ACFQQE_00380 [Glycomyces mayteni]|uniref:hypothetical protein n=1 Tax=Glycomyces mayteni TaxID=543887 RepID=UPI00360A56F6
MNRYLATASLVLGPLLGAIATFLWESDRYGVTASTVLMCSTVAWIYGLLAVWTRIGERRPWVGALGAVLSLAGFAGGMAFSLQGYFEGLFGVSGPDSLAAAAEHPVASAVVLWIPGPAFPLALCALGAALLWTRLAPSGSASSSSPPAPSSPSAASPAPNPSPTPPTSSSSPPSSPSPSPTCASTAPPPPPPLPDSHHPRVLSTESSPSQEPV